MKINNLAIIANIGQKVVPISQIVTFADIDIDGCELIMRPVNKAHVKRIAKSNGQWPDIECVQIQWDGRECFLLVDGRHRLEAARMLKLENIKIVTRSYEDVVEAAMVANLHHGLSLQKPKITEHVIWLLTNGYKPEQIA